MAYSSIKGTGSLTIDDYLDVLPHSNQIKKLSNNSYSTNCVGKNHVDKNPSMGLSQGDKCVVYKCFAGCSQEELTSYFNRRLAHKLEAIDKYWKEKKNKKKESRLRDEAFRSVNSWLVERGL